MADGSEARPGHLYDVASALPYPHIPLQKMRLAMKCGGSYLVTSWTRAVWVRVAKGLSLSLDGVAERARVLTDRLPDACADSARDPSIVAIESTTPSRLVDAIADRVQASKATLGGSASGMVSVADMTWLPETGT